MSLTERESHFEFGENWRAYAKTVDKPRIEQAVIGLRKLFPDGLAGKSFLDIGCGSGLHSIAALELGASSLTAIDIDENSVDATRELLGKHMPDRHWTVSVDSVFDLNPDKLGRFDVVYSWGVLHHTGDMWRAIELASRLVKPGGLYAIAIYTKTPLCELWKIGKRLYKISPRLVQRLWRYVYMGAFLAFLPATNYDPIGFVRNYRKSRGMNFSIDAHDWLGGYPYESATAEEIHAKLRSFGMVKARSFEIEPGSGIWGVGCSEYVYLQSQPPANE